MWCQQHHVMFTFSSSDHFDFFSSPNLNAVLLVFHKFSAITLLSMETAARMNNLQKKSLCFLICSLIKWFFEIKISKNVLKWNCEIDFWERGKKAQTNFLFESKVINTFKVFFWNFLSFFVGVWLNPKSILFPHPRPPPPPPSTRDQAKGWWEDIRTGKRRKHAPTS